MLNCIAVDDENLALDLIEDNIQKIPFLNLVKRCKNAFEAMEVIQNQEIDLLFLDIQMPGITGVQFLQSLTNSPMVIFVTAYKQYALEGFELNVIDYLLKPIDFERFLKAVNKAYELHGLKQKSLVIESVNESKPSTIFVNADYSLVKLKIEEITYIEGLKDYIKIHLNSSTKPIVTRMTMKSIEEKLPSSEFFRVHKSFIVSLDKIESIRNLKIKIGNSQIPVSESYSEEFFKLIGQ
ncbi:MAG: LytTR family DNA-binding domain-containing protein [Bacteroidota bacterium]|jgi:DNA-binding LytR/AlgR family response regulator